MFWKNKETSTWIKYTIIFLHWNAGHLQKDEDGFQVHLFTFIYMAIAQISWVWSQTVFQPPWQQPELIHEDGGSWCGLKITLRLTCWTGFKKLRQHTVSLITFANVLGVPQRTGFLWTWEEPSSVNEESAHGDRNHSSPHLIYIFRKT